MAGQIFARSQIPNAKFFPKLDNGVRPALLVRPSNSGFNGVDYLIFAEYPYEPNVFIVVRDGPLYFSSNDTTQAILDSAVPSVWTGGAAPTFADIANGVAPYVALDGNSYTLSAGVAVRIQDWLLGYPTAAKLGPTNRDILNATSLPYFPSVLLVTLQQQMDMVDWVHIPTAPAPWPSPDVEYPALGKGDITTAAGIVAAQFTRVVGGKDPNNGNRPLLGSIPVW